MKHSKFLRNDVTEMKKLKGEPSVKKAKTVGGSEAVTAQQIGTEEAAPPEQNAATTPPTEPPGSASGPDEPNIWELLNAPPKMTPEEEANWAEAEEEVEESDDCGGDVA